MRRRCRPRFRARCTYLGLVVGLSALVAVGCGSSDDSSEDGGTTAAKRSGTIAFLLPQNQFARFEELDKPLFEKNVKELCPDCEVLHYNAGNYDSARQLQQAQSALAQGADVLVLDPADATASRAIVELAKQRGVPVIDHDVKIESSDDLVAHVTFDAYAQGEDQAVLLARELDKIGKPRGPVLFLGGEPTQGGARLLREAALAKLDELGVEVLASADTKNWDPANAQRQMDQWITKYGKDGFVGVHAAASPIAAGVVASMKSAGIDPSRYPITGLDPDLAEVQRVLAGEQTFSLYKPINELERVAAEMAVRVVRGEEPLPDADTACSARREQTCIPGVPTVVIPALPVTRETIAETVVRDGQFTIDQICTAAYAKACRDAGLVKE